MGPPVGVGRYHMMVQVADAALDAPPDDGGFFALGQFRSAEKARAHLHSSYATGIYSLAALEPDEQPQAQARPLGAPDSTAPPLPPSTSRAS